MPSSTKHTGNEPMKDGITPAQSEMTAAGKHIVEAMKTDSESRISMCNSVHVRIIQSAVQIPGEMDSNYN